MGNYNPHAPYILGQEWVPIRQADYTPDDVTERGYTFVLEFGATPVSGAYYVESVPENQVSQVVDMMAVYPSGHETLTGPIKSLRIPVSAISAPGPPNNTDISAGIAALFNPSDDQTILFQDPGGDGGDELEVSFDTEPYAAVLLGKRILDIRVHYTVVVTDLAEAVHVNFLVSHLALNARIYYRPDQVEVTLGGAAPSQVNYFSLTDANPFWQSTVNANLTRDIYPWRFQELNRFRASAGADRLALVVVTTITPGEFALLGFLELEVIYCEETRVLYGGRRTSNLNASTHILDTYSTGQNLVRLLTPAFAQPSALAAGEYVVTLNHNNLGIFTVFEGAPVVRAVRELYQLPHQRGLRVNQSTTLDAEFTATLDDPVLTHLTLHTASSIVTGVHAYGTRVGAPVYGTVTATQEIEDDPVGAARTYQQVRFYARRYGNTTVPLTLADVATGLNTVTIRPDELDALPEIVDGWREVTLRFANPPTFSTTVPNTAWRWSSTGEMAGNQWQILAADGPSTSVTAPASLVTALQTYPATYWAPLGNVAELDWQSPTITGTASDDATDAVLIFSQDPAIVTGFTVVGAGCSIAVTGIGEGCNLPDECLPTAIYGNQLSWDTGGVFDWYDRFLAAGWGTSSSGDPWTVILDGVGGSVAVDGAAGTSTTTTADNSNFMHVPAASADVVQYFEITTPALATGGFQLIESQLRFTDVNNYYGLQILPNTNGFMLIRWHRVVLGVDTVIGSSVTTVTYAADRPINILTQVVGSRLSGKVWSGDDGPPDTWTVEVTDMSLASGTHMGMRLGVAAGNTNVPITYSVDNYCGNPASLADGKIEIQRRDHVTDWQTIMLSSGVCVNEFCDVEARVGVESEYRIRMINVLDFTGPWVTGSATLPAPGVAGAGDGNSVLIFTSNAATASSLAYVMQWENDPIETFAFPEANFVQLQRMFGKDYFTAFYPLERGGTQFTRTLLVNAAAISPTLLPNFDDLRDLAWAQLDYVCIRDELGNRWFANVRVPDGVVRRDRTIYLAQIQVTQVTDTASPVDPG